MTWRTWREAMQEALYGPAGFYRTHRPADHFRTSVHASPLFAEAMLRLAERSNADTIVDVGAGGGELLQGLHDLSGGRLTLAGVELGPRPVTLPRSITWHAQVADLPRFAGLLVANEWLDDVPVDVVEGGALVLVDADGYERPGPPPTDDDAAWLARWWPGAARAEIGRPRDEAWAAAVGRLSSGLAVAVDYAVDPARHHAGTLTGYRHGREVRPTPDGSCNLTAHVHLGACAAAGSGAGAAVTMLTTQRAALRALGVGGRRPPVELARTDPVGYARGLQRAGEAAELTAVGGLGDFAWLVQGVGVPLPFSTGTMTAVFAADGGPMP